MGPFGERRRWRWKEPDLARRRAGKAPIFAFLRALVILMFGILAIQLINLQVIRGDEFSRLAEINAIREVPIPAARGLIFDRNGTPLVQNSARFSAAILPGDLPERGEAAVYRLVSPVIGVSTEEIGALVAEGIERQGEYSPVLVKKDIDRETALVLMELAPHAPGLQVVVEPSRQYTAGSLLSHVLGYVGPLSAEEYAELRRKEYLLQDFIGKTGVELVYEDMLRGKLGKKLIEVDAFGRELNVISERPPVDGANLVLTVDLDLQEKTAEILQQYSGDSENAAAVVMNVKTGELLSMVSLPGFDNNAFSGPLSPGELAALVDDPGKPLVNHAIAERYPPGSTFKTIVGAGALQEGVAQPSTMITSRGSIYVEHELNPNVVYVYRDWASLGPLDFYKGLAMSSNVYFYYLAGGKPDEGFQGLGEERVARYARAFGFGSPTGIDLPGESPGLVPDARWKQEQLAEAWTLGDTYNFGIGQGYMAATPLQVLTAVSAIANGGKLVNPHVASEFRDSRGNVLRSMEMASRGTVPVNEEHLRVVREAMRRSVTEGVAKNGAVQGIEVAGKTGTAEFGPQLPGGRQETHGWFAGFAPYAEPEIAVVVFLQKGSGGDDASPAAARIIDYYFHRPQPAEKPEPAQARQAEQAP